MHREFSYDLRRKMTMVCAILNLLNDKYLLLKLVCTTLTDEYELDLGGKTQPSVNIDDLLYSTYHLLAVCDIAFPTFRCMLFTRGLALQDTFSQETSSIYGRGRPRACKGKQETIPCTPCAWFSSVDFYISFSPQILHSQCISLANGLICMLTKCRLRDPGFLYIFRRSFSGSLALPRHMKHIVGLSSRDLTQTEAMA